jgi:hypothetical protein
MRRSTSCVPKYCLHEASRQAVVTIAGTDFYLGPWKSKASLLEYDCLITEWIASGRPALLRSAASAITVAEIVLQYWRFAKENYRKDGQPTGSIHGIKVALRLLREHYGHTLAREFGPLALAALRQRLIEAGNSRTNINDPLGRIRRVFKWAASMPHLASGYSRTCCTNLSTVSAMRSSISPDQRNAGRPYSKRFDPPS